jgi:5-methylcytosine-specific restriction endonuclease McrA
MSYQSKACDVSPKIRDTVKRRDNMCCVVCGFPYALTIAHVFINRSHGGLGVKENLATLCIECHSKLDHGKKIHSESVRVPLESYMNKLYPSLDIKKLKYEKE